MCPGIIVDARGEGDAAMKTNVFTPLPPDAPPGTSKPFSVNLNDNLQWLKHAVEQIAPLHGRLVTIADLVSARGHRLAGACGAG
jgi:hypothetical protein